MIGQTISHYRVVEKLGGGGMGVVYKAEDIELGRFVALKFLPEAVRANAVALNDLRQETHKSRMLSHPNILRIYDLYEAPDEAAFISMEYVDGPTLTRAVRENGPLAVHARMEIGGVAAGMRATLCRCGASSNKPYCDGSHVGAGFLASGEPATKTSEPLAARDGALKITPYPNGPLGVSGAVEILSGTGREIERTQATALCRCGGSKNKPYCDGTHKAIGFVAPATPS